MITHNLHDYLILDGFCNLQPIYCTEYVNTLDILGCERRNKWVDERLRRGNARFIPVAAAIHFAQIQFYYNKYNYYKKDVLK